MGQAAIWVPKIYERTKMATCIFPDKNGPSPADNLHNPLKVSIFLRLFEKKLLLMQLSHNRNQGLILFLERLTIILFGRVLLK